MRRFGIKRGGRTGRATGGLMVIAAFAITGGCGLLESGMGEGLASVRDEARRTREEITRDREGLLAAASALPVGGAHRARVEALAAERAGQEAAFSRAVEGLDGALAAASATADDPAGSIEAGASVLAPLVPPGAQLPLLLGAGFVASVWRAVRLKKSAASIAEGLEKAMSSDDGLREGLKRNAATLRSVQTPTAQRIVDEVKRARPMVRLPL